ncbi:MAG: MaoC/PaaZ C-terminal domain-containing protein [Planctomycetota bacterium]
MTGKTLDEIEIGSVYFSDEQLMTLESIIEFASVYDPQPMHLDQAAAADGPFGQLTASGWQTLSLTMKMMAERKPFGDTPLIGVGVDGIEFKRPVFADTRIRVRAEVTGKRPSLKPGRGFVTIKVETQNADTGEVVVRQNWTVMVPA